MIPGSEYIGRAYKVAPNGNPAKTEVWTVRGLCRSSGKAILESGRKGKKRTHTLVSLECIEQWETAGMRVPG